jgi:hypothetical protein
MDSVPPTPRGWSDGGGSGTGGVRRDAGTPVAAEAGTPAIKSPVEPQDLEGEQVYVLYRPDGTSRAEGDAADVRESADSQARR